jgi:phospholipid/cholesterol/gamma-HCH transport system substrate-binding protein
MRSTRINYVAVGLFVLVVVAGFLTALALLTGRTGASDRYHTVYDNVAGIAFGTKVLFEGYPVGQVERIEPVTTDGDVRFRVEFSVQEGFPIPRDSEAVIASSGLLAGSSIEIRQGQAAQTLEPGAQVAAGASADVFAAVSSVAGEINSLNREGLMPLMDKLNTYVEVFGDTLTERTPRLLDDLESVSGALAGTAPDVTGNLESFTARLNDGVASPDNLERIRRTLDHIEAASRNLNEGVLGPENRAEVDAALANVRAFSDEFVQLASELRRSQQRVDSLIATLDETISENRENVDQSVADLRYTLEVVSQHIDAISYNLEGTSRNMHEFARDIRRNPGLLLGGRGSGGRH